MIKLEVEDLRQAHILILVKAISNNIIIKIIHIEITREVNMDPIQIHIEGIRVMRTGIILNIDKKLCNKCSE